MLHLIHQEKTTKKSFMLNNFSHKNINFPTPAKWVKIGLTLLAVSSFLSASAFAADKFFLGYLGLSLGILGTVLSNFFKTSKNDE